MGKVSAEHKYMGKISLAAGVIWRTDAAFLVDFLWTHIHTWDLHSRVLVSSGILETMHNCQEIYLFQSTFGSATLRALLSRPERCTRSRVFPGERQQRATTSRAGFGYRQVDRILDPFREIEGDYKLSSSEAAR